MLGITSRASTLSGFNESVALSIAFPSTILISAGGCPGIVGALRKGSTDATPSTCINAAETEAICS